MTPSPRRVVVLHDVNPRGFPLATLVANAAERPTRLENGSLKQPLRPPRLLELLEKNPRHRIVVAPHAMPALEPSPGVVAHSVLPVAHPLLRMLHVLEAEWQAFVAADGERRDSAATFEASVAAGVRTHLRRYPYANFYTGFLLGGQGKVEVEEVPALAALVLGKVRIGLEDFQATLREATAAALAEAGIAPGAPPESGSAAPLVPALKRWRERLSRPTFQRLCKLSAADLLFYDAVAAAVAAQPGLPEALRSRVAATVEAAAAVTGHRDRAKSEPTPAPKAEPRGSGLIEPDPVLGWRLRPNASTVITVADDQVPMETDDAGCRPVPGQPTTGKRTLIVYGCSCVFGWAVPVAATLCARLQAALPDWRIENRAANGYGQSQNLLQLMRDLRWNAPDHVTFTWIEPHLARNVAAPTQIQRQTELAGADKLTLIRSMPRAGLDDDGEVVFRNVAYCRPDLIGLDLTDFNPDAYYAYAVTAALFRRAHTLVRQRGGRFFVTTLREALPPPLARMLEADDIAVLDATARGAAFTSAFDNQHPNAAAHAHYGATLAAHLQRVDADPVPA